MRNMRIEGNDTTKARGGGKLGALAFLMTALGAPAIAGASTAANTVITNTATVNYADAGGNAQTAVQASASVTVSLVPTAVTLSSPGNQTIEQGNSATLSYTITSNANGPDTYDLTNADTRTNVAGGALTYPGGNSIVLGGSTLADDADAGETTITTPYDGTNDSVVNGLAVGDTVVIGANAYVISAIVENPGSNTATITIPAITGATVATGAVIGERQTFSATQTSGTVTAGSSGTHSLVTTAASNTTPAVSTAQSTATVITVTRPSLTVQKLVSSDNGATFAATANATPSTSLIYKIVITNTGVGVATSVDTTDVLPAYITYVAGSGKRATAVATTYAAATALTEGSGGYDYTAGTRTVSYNPGSPGFGTVAGGGGVLVLFFRATVN